MYIRNSGVAHAPESIELTMNTILTKPPQNDFRFVGAVELPPMELVPFSSHGYIVIDAQYGAMLVSSFLYIKCEVRRRMYSSDSSLLYSFLMRSVSMRRFSLMKAPFGSSPISVAIFLFSTLAFESNLLPDAALAA